MVDLETIDCLLQKYGQGSGIRMMVNAQMTGF